MIKKFFYSLGRFFVGLVLFTITLAFIPIGLIGLIYSMVEIIWKRKLVNVLLRYGKFFTQLAIVMDILLGVMSRELLNDLFIKTEGFQIGKKVETVSSALGKNQRDNTLTKMGWGLVWILDKLDPNHCIKSINDCV